MSDDEAKRFHDSDGNACSLDELCRREPGWAAAWIRVEREEMASLRARLAAVEAENAKLRALCGRAAKSPLDLLDDELQLQADLEAAARGAGK